jgi:hypothetical protein
MECWSTGVMRKKCHSSILMCPQEVQASSLPQTLSPRAASGIFDFLNSLDSRFHGKDKKEIYRPSSIKSMLQSTNTPSLHYSITPVLHSSIPRTDRRRPRLHRASGRAPASASGSVRFLSWSTSCRVQPRTTLPCRSHPAQRAVPAGDRPSP